MSAGSIQDSSAATPSAPKEITGPREGSLAKLRRRLAGDLDVIVLKALRKESQSRYSTVEQMAEDIRRHLDGLPITATKGSWRYRAGKFVRRHKTAMAAAAVVVLAVLAGVGATLREARIAAANARRAERRFSDVRKLANSFLFEFHDAIEHLPGSTPARELVVKRALEYLDSLSQEAGNDPSLRLELAAAYEKVGSVQGSPYRDNLGNLQGALVSFQRAIDIRTQLLQGLPRDQEIRSLLAREYGEIGDVYMASGDLKTALTNYQRGLAVLAAEQHPNTKSNIRAESLYVRYGIGLAQSGDLAQAVENYRQALLVIDKLIKENPEDHENVRDKGVTYIHLTDAYKQMRQLPEALASAGDAYAVFHSLLDPANAQTGRDLGIADERTADLLEEMGEREKALGLRQSTLASDQAAAQSDPSDQLLRRDLYQSYSKVAYLQLAMGNLTEALTNQRRCVALIEKEVKSSDSAEMRDDLQTNYFHLGEIMAKAGKTQEALHYFEKAQTLAQSLIKANPADLDTRAGLSEIEMNLSDAGIKLGKGKVALAGYRDALSIAETVVATNPTNSELRILLARVSERLATYYAAQHNCGEARPFYQKSLDLWNDLQLHHALGSNYAGEPAAVSQKLARCTASTAGRP